MPSHKWSTVLAAITIASTCLTSTVSGAALSITDQLVLETRNESASSAPIVHTRHQGSFQGLYNSSYGVEEFYGIPFAQPPLGELRFRKTVPVEKYTKKDIRDATTKNKICLQSDTLDTNAEADEDCLYLQIHRPAGTKQGDDLPILLWIYGGAWTGGSTGQLSDPTSLVSRSIELGQKVIHVAGEYRLGAFGFMGGSEVENASRNGSAVPNAGYYDQQEVMKWVQKNIRSFGGDPDKVTIFGQSAGAQSVGAHLIANGGDNQGLFRGAVLQSGAPATAARYKPADYRPQRSYNQLLNQTSCGDLACLRNLTAEKLRYASANINIATYIYGYPGWIPLIDGHFIPDVPSKLYSRGKVADVPLIIGTALDEGTLFAGWAANVTTDDTLIEDLLIAQGEETRSLTPSLLKLWPDESTTGSPFRPELLGAAADDRFFGPESDFKRASAIFGDWAFHAPARSLLNATHNLNRKSWGYLFSQPSSQYYGTEPYIGIPHASDIVYVNNVPTPAPENLTGAQAKYCNASQIKETADFMSAAWINFAHYLDPNGKSKRGEHHWPSYTKTAADGKHGVGKIMHIQGGNLTTIRGDYRKEQVEFFLRHKDTYRL